MKPTIACLSSAIAVAVALGSSTVLAGKQDQAFAIFSDKDASGGDYKELDGVSLDKCESGCQQDIRCKAFTYNGPKRVCFLKNTAEFQLTEHQGAITGIARRSGHLGLSLQKIAFTDRIRSFIEDDFLAGDISSAPHLQSIYADKVDYWDKGRVPVSTVIADKLAYAQTWPTIVYELRPTSLAIERISNPNTYSVQFQYDFVVSNEDKKTSGVGRSDLVLDLSSSEPRITSEKGGTLSRKATVKSAASQFAFLVDKDSPNSDYREVDGASIQACATKCVHENECTAFTYNVARRICFLKNGGSSELIDFQGAITGIKQVPHSTKSDEEGSSKPAVDANSGLEKTPQAEAKPEAGEQSSDINLVYLVYLRGGDCKFRVGQNWQDCREPIIYSLLQNGRSLIQFLTGDDVIALSGGSDHQPDLNDLYIDIDTLRITKSGEEPLVSQVNGQCHMNGNNDASQIYYFNCDVGNVSVRVENIKYYERLCGNNLRKVAPTQNCSETKPGEGGSTEPAVDPNSESAQMTRDALSSLRSSAGLVPRKQNIKELTKDLSEATAVSDIFRYALPTDSTKSGDGVSTEPTANANSSEHSMTSDALSSLRASAGLGGAHKVGGSN